MYFNLTKNLLCFLNSSPSHTVSINLPSMSVKLEDALEMVDTELISCSPISSVSSPTPSVIVCWCCRWLGFIISRAWREQEEITPTHRQRNDIHNYNSCEFLRAHGRWSFVPRPTQSQNEPRDEARHLHRMLTVLRMFSLCVFISEASSLERWISSEKCLGFTETLLSCCWSIELNMTSKERGSIPGSLGVPVTV